MLSVLTFSKLQTIYSYFNQQKRHTCIWTKETLTTVKKTVYKGYIHTCDIITVYKFIYLDILFCLKITTVLIYIYIHTHLLPSTKHTYMKMYQELIGFLIICFKRYTWRDFIISFKIKKKHIGKSINYYYFSDIY